MGADGGTIPTRCELVTTKKKPEQRDKDTHRLFQWQHCHLTQEPLTKPVVACQMGSLYNKEAVIKMLLDKTEQIRHIKGLKDICPLDLTPNPSYNGKQSSVGGSHVDKTGSPWICPIMGLEMNGRFKFVFDWTNGRVLSDRAYKMVKADESSRIPEENVIVINPDEGEETDALRVKMDARRARDKAAKKAKKEAKKKEEGMFKAPAPIGGEGDMIVAPPPSKKMKEDRSKTDDKSKIKSSAKAREQSTVQNDPSKSETYKSLFSSHKSAQNRPKGNWVTFDPRYN